LIWRAQEDFRGTANTTTNAGTQFLLATQPPGVYLTPTSHHAVIFQHWTPGDIPINNIGFGGGSTVAFDPHTTSSGTIFNGHSSNNIYLTNSIFTLWGVPPEDPVPDNYTLPNTLTISFRACRGSGVSSRRNQIQKSDTLGRIQFFGETGTESTSTANQIKTAELFVKSLNTFTSTATGGAVVVLTTLNSGTNVESPRLSLSNIEHVYSSDIHSFKSANSTTIAIINTSSFIIKSVRSVSGAVPSGFSPMYYNKTTGEVIVVS
jgi:hypothetical protein